MKVVVRRSGLRMWLMAMAGIPLLVIAIDVLFTRNFSNQLRELLFRPQDTQIFEVRDVIYGWVIAAFALLFLIWGLKELFLPAAVVECREDGLAVRLAGPFRSPTVISWDAISDVRGDEAEDEGTPVPLLTVDLLQTEGIPEDPWGGRWLSSSRLGVLADDWAESPDEVAAQILEFALERKDRARFESAGERREAE